MSFRNKSQMLKVIKQHSSRDFILDTRYQVMGELGMESQSFTCLWRGVVGFAANKSTCVGILNGCANRGSVCFFQATRRTSYVHEMHALVERSLAMPMVQQVHGEEVIWFCMQSASGNGTTAQMPTRLSATHPPLKEGAPKCGI